MMFPVIQNFAYQLCVSKVRLYKAKLLKKRNTNLKPLVEETESEIALNCESSKSTRFVFLPYYQDMTYTVYNK